MFFQILACMLFEFLDYNYSFEFYVVNKFNLYNCISLHKNGPHKFMCLNTVLLVELFGKD